MDSCPSLIHIKSKIEYYNSIEQDVDDIKHITFVMSTELSAGKLFIMCSRYKI